MLESKSHFYILYNLTWSVSLQGAYRDDNGKPVVLNVVREAEGRIAGSNFMEYLPIGGLKPFNDLSLKLAYGGDAACIKEGRVAAVQSLSGTGAQHPFKVTLQHRRCM